MSGQIETHTEYGTAPKAGEEIEQQNTTRHAVRYGRGERCGKQAVVL
jgi:hypothetical protein